MGGDREVSASPSMSWCRGQIDRTLMESSVTVAASSTAIGASLTLVTVTLTVAVSVAPAPW